VRAFVALPISDELKQAVGRVQGDLRSRLPPHAIRWTAPHQVHVTLRFLGGVNSEAVGALGLALDGACRTVQPLELSLEEFGCFPHLRRPRVLWLGLKGDLEPLQHLQVLVSDAVAPFAASTEDRTFSPHVTLGRLRDAPEREAGSISRALAGFSVGRLGAWQAGCVELLESRTGPAGAVYTQLGRFRLGT
jgi:2'-5' RNA ligase